MAVSIAHIASSMLRARLRSRLLSACATAQSLAALAALLNPDWMADAMGLFLVGVNGYSQFYALYVGVRLATAGLALLAARQGDQPLLGDLAALFILAQPLGRFVAAFAIGLPQGLLFVVSGIELAVGLALIGLRPQGRFLSIRPSP
ncbi:hypothetical protein [Massilia putida]|uniref:hypothetical protein n=1 Tax=Massilia putida TaxID=1141883 RepID=UPI000953634F|nr:hypothetical protein [Massilia putida]